MIESAGAERTAHAWEALVCDGMPGGDAAIADRRKLIGYCLNPKHPRGKHEARVFATLGFTAENADALRRSGFPLT